MADLPPPKWTDAPPLPLEGKTSPGFIVTAEYMKRKLRKRSIASGGIGTIGAGGLIALFNFFDARATSQLADHDRATTAIYEALVPRVVTIEKRADRMDDRFEFVFKQNNAMLDALHVPLRLRPEPVPPLDLDGGR